MSVPRFIIYALLAALTGCAVKSASGSLAWGLAAYLALMTVGLALDRPSPPRP